MIVLALAIVALIGAAPNGGKELSAVEIERRTDALAAELRCPVCQALSVRDSPSDAATTMRRRIRELVAAGRSDEQVRQFFVQRYGDWILLSPPRHGISLAVWVLPPVLLVGGLLLLALSIRRWTTRARLLAEAGERQPEALKRARRRIAQIENSEPE